MRGATFLCLVMCVLVCWNQVCSAAPLVKPEALPDLQSETDSESLLELTHYTAQGFQELGIHEQSGSNRPVFELAPEDLTVEAALANSSSLRSPVIFVTGKARPQRRKQGQPFVTIISKDEATATGASESLPVIVLNKAVTFLESIAGRRLYPYRLIASSAEILNSGQAPYVIYDVSRGDVHIGKRYVQSWAGVPDQLNSTLHDMLYKVVGGVQADLVKNGTSWSSNWMEDLVSMATAAISSGVMATVRAKPPVWFCFVCPIVLGEFFPFFFNLGLGHIAEVICQRYHLTDEECLDLWVGAVALALVLSLSSVVAIVSVCRLRECAKPLLR